MKEKGKRLLALLTTVCMVLSLLPVMTLSAAAANMTWKELQTAMSKGGTITLSSDVTCDDQSLGPLKVTGGVSVTLDLNGHTIDRNAKSAISKGYVIYVDSSSLTIIDSAGGGKITGGAASGDGGGFYVRESTLNMRGVTVTGCSAGSNGGGLYCTNKSVVTMSDCVIQGNTGSYGGGLGVRGGTTLTMTNVTIDGNTDNSSGGGGMLVADVGTSVQMEGGSVSNNSSNSAGGGIYVSGNKDLSIKVRLKDVEISNNTAKGSGGGIYFDSSTVDLINCRITNNTSASTSYGGGGIYCGTYATLRIGRDTVVKGNSVPSGKGGGLYVDPSANVTMSGTAAISGNKAKTDKDVYSTTTIRMSDYQAYILETVTGVSPGNKVDYFAVRYRDNDNIPRVHYIFPQLDLRTSYIEAAAAGGSAKSNLDTLSKRYRLELKSTSDDYVNATALQSYRRDMFLFQPEYYVKEITGIELFGRYAGGSIKNEWSCQSLRIYGADSLYGLETYGGFSTQYYIDFDGAVLAELENTGTAGQMGVTFRWNDGSDKLFRIGADQNSEYALKTEVSEYSTHSQADTIFKMDIADVYGAGIEAFATPYGGSGQLKDLPLEEVMAMELTYRDSFGGEYRLALPVVIGSLEYARKNSGGKITDSSKVVGYMQQGESIVFGGKLLDIAEIVDCKLRYGQEIAMNTCGLSWSSGSSKLSNMASDTLSITGFSVYSSADATVVPGYNGCSIVHSLSGNPTHYYTAKTTAGISLGFDANNAGTSAFSLSLNPFSGNSRLAPQEPSDRYLLILTTDDAQFSSTTDDLECQLKYQSVDGSAQVSEFVNIRTSMRDYFGYWPGAYEDVAYRMGASCGGELYALVQIKNVDHFTGVTIRLVNGGKDDWQGKEIKLYKLNNQIPLGKREASWTQVKDNDGNAISDRRFSRQYSGADISPADFENDAKLLIQPQAAVTTSFETQTLVEKGMDVDWGGLRYSMTYAEAVQGLGFKKPRASYSVAVQVAGDVVTETENGDCGSKNQFYFQLVFEQGKSGYVLANQQLSADGFRSGRMETFRVTMNQDYGNLTAINIIPENPNDPDAAFDKLKISYVEVRKECDDELVPTWKLDINDWVSIDYTDTGAQQTIGGQQGRTEEELARSFLVTSSGYSVNLLFALTTGKYTDTPFNGALRATINYYDISGNLRSTDVDVIEAMYEYANIEPTWSTVTVTESSGSWDTGRKYAQLDPTFMLRENHTDRFTVALSDVKEITSVTLHAAAKTSGTWTISALNVYRITSSGILNINTQNEYQYTSKTALLCTNRNDQGYELKYFLNGASQSQPIEMDGNPIEVDLSKGWVSALDYVPKSKDDYINIYAFLDEEASTGTVYKPTAKELQAAIQYSVSTAQAAGSNGVEATVSDGSCQTKALLQKDSSRNMYYAKGIRTSGMVGIGSLTLRSNDTADTNTPIDYVIIEQVRSGVVINTYYLSFFGTFVDDLPHTGWPDSVYLVWTEKEEKQSVSLLLGEDFEAMDLLSKKNDIVLSISYISTNDPTGTEIMSPNIFLSEQGVEKINPGQVINVDFNQRYVQQITGITVTAIGTLNGKVSVQMACAGTYTESDEGWSNTAWFSFANPVTGIGLSPRRLILTASTLANYESTVGSVSPVTITFQTAKDAAGGGGGTDAPIRMKLVYDTQYSAMRAVDYADMRRYLTSGSFQTSGDAVIQLMVPDISELRYIEVEPYENANPYDSESWTLGDVKLHYIINGQEKLIERTVNDTALEGTGLKINLSKIVLSVDTLTYSSRSRANSYHTVRSDVGEGKVSVLVEAGRTVDLTPTLMGSLDTIGYTCERVVGEATSTASGCLSERNGTLTFTPLENTSGTPDTYRVTIYSVEIPSICVTVDLTVESSVSPKEEIDMRDETPALPPSENTGGTKEDSEGESSGDSDGGDV